MRSVIYFGVLLVFLFTLTGCGGGGGSSTSSPTPVASVVTVAAVPSDYNGIWRGTYTYLGSSQKPIVIQLTGNNGSGGVIGSVTSEGVVADISGTISSDGTVVFTFLSLVDGTTWQVKLGKLASGGLGIVQIGPQGAATSGSGSCSADSVSGKPLQGTFPVYYWLDQAGSNTRSGSMTLWYLSDSLYVGKLSFQDGSSTSIQWGKGVGSNYWVVFGGAVPPGGDINAGEALSQDMAVNGLLDSTLTAAANDGMVSTALHPYSLRMIGYTLVGGSYTHTPYIFKFYLEGTPD